MVNFIQLTKMETYKLFFTENAQTRKHSQAILSQTQGWLKYLKNLILTKTCPPPVHTPFL